MILNLLPYKPIKIYPYPRLKRKQNNTPCRVESPPQQNRDPTLTFLTISRSCPFLDPTVLWLPLNPPNLGLACGTSENRSLSRSKSRTVTEYLFYLFVESDIPGFYTSLQLVRVYFYQNMWSLVEWLVEQIMVKC